MEDINFNAPRPIYMISIQKVVALPVSKIGIDKGGRLPIYFSQKVQQPNALDIIEAFKKK